jgi:hypothetical protein
MGIQGKGHVPGRGLLRLARAAAVAGVFLLCARPLAAAAPAYADEDNPVLVWTDATGPLFDVTNLRPGSTLTNCVTVSYSAPGATSLRMAAPSTTGELADFLDVQISAGTNGGYGDCASFSGDDVYFGTLGSFGREYADPSTGLPMNNSVASSGTVTVRVSLSMRDENEAQGKVSDSSFTWYALDGETVLRKPIIRVQPPSATVPVIGPGTGPIVGAPSAAPAPSSDSLPAPSAAPTVATTGGKEKTGAQVGSGAAPRPSQQGPGNSSQPAAANPGAPVDPGSVPTDPARRSSGAPRSLGAAISQGLDNVAQFVERAAPAVIKAARPPLGLLLVGIVFLLIQYEIDRRDPKLALAPAYADPDLAFDYTPTPIEA